MLLNHGIKLIMLNNIMLMESDKTAQKLAVEEAKEMGESTRRLVMEEARETACAVAIITHHVLLGECIGPTLSYSP